MGTAYKRQYGSFSLGNTLPYVLQHAPCQVLLLRQAMSDGLFPVVGSEPGGSDLGADQ
jgi:hypothetical protein